MFLYYLMSILWCDINICFSKKIPHFTVNCLVNIYLFFNQYLCMLFKNQTSNLSVIKIFILRIILVFKNSFTKIKFYVILDLVPINLLGSFL